MSGRDFDNNENAREQDTLRRKQVNARREAQLKVSMSGSPPPAQLQLGTSRLGVADSSSRSREEDTGARHSTERELHGGSPVNQYYNAQVILTVALTRAEAEALRAFLTRTPPRQSSLGWALGAISDALDEKNI
jgi:hypothetical protein